MVTLLGQDGREGNGKHSSSLRLVSNTFQEPTSEDHTSPHFRVQKHVSEGR